MEPDTVCPGCGSTDLHIEEELYRPWVLDVTCNTCGHQWKESNA